MDISLEDYTHKDFPQHLSFFIKYNLAATCPPPTALASVFDCPVSHTVCIFEGEREVHLKDTHTISD